MPPALLLRKPVGVSSSRCSLPRCAAAATPAPISTAFTALMPIMACARSASSRSNTGSPSPGGTPLAITVTFAPTESPVAADLPHEVFELLDARRIGAEERIVVGALRIHRIDGERADLAEIAADAARRALVCRYLRAMAPAATRIDGLARRRASAAAVVAKAVFLLVGVVGVAGTEAILDLLVVARARVGVLDQDADGRARGPAFEHAGQDLAPRRLPCAGSRTATCRCGGGPRRPADPPRASSSPGGQPSTMQPSAGPWLSPKVVTVNSLPMELPDIRLRPSLTARASAGTPRHRRARNRAR